MDTFRLTLKLKDQVVVVSATNTSRRAITIVAHPRYLGVEVQNARGSYVAGVGDKPATMPAAADYPQVDPGATIELVRWPITWTDGCAIGGYSFDDLAVPSRLRVTYKGELVMPNLPRKQQRDFVRGPITADVAGLKAP